MTLVRMLARPMLAAIFVVQGVRAIKNPDAMVPAAKPFTDQMVPTVKRMAPDQVARRVPENPRTLVRLNGVVHLVGGLALASGQGRRAAAWLLAASMVPTTMAGHAYWEEDDPAQRANQQIHFLKNLSMLGGLLLAAVDTEGKPGLWWRARYSARDAKKASKRLSRAARREARLAAKVAEHQAHLAAKTAKPFKSGKASVASAGATAAKALHSAKSTKLPHPRSGRHGKFGRHGKHGMFGTDGVRGRDGMFGKRGRSGRSAKPAMFKKVGRDGKHGKDGAATKLVTTTKP